MQTLTCHRHNGSRYLTKGPGHSLFFIRADPAMVRQAFPHAIEDTIELLARVPFGRYECPCPESDLVPVPEPVPEPEPVPVPTDQS